MQTRDTEFLDVFDSYCDNIGFFSEETMWIQGHRQLYELNAQFLAYVALTPMESMLNLFPFGDEWTTRGLLPGRGGFVGAHF
jgi:hypothetical protein